jgi:hypothetical protein
MSPGYSLPVRSRGATGAERRKVMQHTAMVLRAPAPIPELN